MFLLFMFYLKQLFNTSFLVFILRKITVTTTEGLFGLVELDVIVGFMIACTFAVLLTHQDAL